MKESTFGVLCLILALTSFAMLAYDLSKSSCEVKSQSFSESKYTSLGGCMVKHKGMWLPLENIRGFD